MQASTVSGDVILALGSRERKADGKLSAPARLNMKRGHIQQLPLTEDREIISAILGGQHYYGFGDSGSYLQIQESALLTEALAATVMPRVIATGRCYLKLYKPEENPKPLVWDAGEPWRFELEMKTRSSKGWALTGVLRRGEERLALQDTALITRTMVFTAERAAWLEKGTPREWIMHMHNLGAIVAPERDVHDLLAELLKAPGLPPVSVSDELSYEELRPQPKPSLKILAQRGSAQAKEKLRAMLVFDYEGWAAAALEESRGFYDAERRRYIKRDPSAEAEAAEMLNGLGFRRQTAAYLADGGGWELAPSKLPKAVRTLMEAGWHVEAEGKIFRRPGAHRMDISSGVDWFELHGEVQYGETTAHLPELLEALKRGDNVVRLGDGTFGVLPEEWLERIGALAGLGAMEDGHIRFRRNQAGLLDALLAAQPETSCDKVFARVRDELRRFEGVTPAAQPEGFVGQLRDYQREGLGWMDFLRRFSFGGCLADDMGVGKTAQVLALLENRRMLRSTGEVTKPSLVVVPRSLIFNWKEEAARFTPRLRVLDYSGAERNGHDLGGHDLVLATYGTLRRDIPRMKDIEFDYVVLDEAQAIKNADTESAKAARLLQSDHRLALSGTPVENHIGELFSLFEFLNPGMLGTASVFKLTGSAARNLNDDTRGMLAHALRPFILRRTKEQVASELPAKTEQTIYCEMEPEQRKLYNELRKHYRDSLLGRIAKEGLAKSKIQVLEALLRLRQAACHPGLIDVKRSNEASAKLDVLLAQLKEVREEGHKTLVFSQFTSFLKILRGRLDADGTQYEYLDGATRDRQARVEKFQGDKDCKLFLISLKAGGLGLNLTAADYVFLLDPWWNPAVEAQAIDRTHRIGQTRRVFAYRLIARDTVEEKVLELQKSKRDLAAAIIDQDNSVIKNLQREDLELLLS